MTDAATTDRPRVLAVHEDVATLRLIREAFLEFTDAEVDTSPQAEYAFELALQRQYRLIFVSLALPVIPGETLYELIGKAYTHCHAGARAAPPVAFIADGPATTRHAELLRDARVRGVLAKPLTIDRVLHCADGMVARKPGR